MQDKLELATGKGSELDLGHFAALWPWAPIFAGSRLQSFKDYVDRMMAGGINPSMPMTAAYAEPFKLSTEEHAQINPYLQPCVPLSHCWPYGYRAKLTAQEQCEYCCNPAHGGLGDPSCFDATFTFQECCQPLAGQEHPAAPTPPAQAQPDPEGIGNPMCFDATYTFQKCCSPDLGPSGDPSCFDGQFTYYICCMAQPKQQARTETQPQKLAPEDTTPQPSQNSAEAGRDQQGLDKSEHCAAWAKLGECRTNKAYMMKNCKTSCMCIDESEHCEAWAKGGECNTNVAFMLKKCRRACGKC